MPLNIGSRLGHYDVTALIGEGGMGQVYQATDTQLKRQVALKVLPEAFATDPGRLARFQREAELLASLNHPNIAQIHGLEEADGVRALVLELVEGPTLADRAVSTSLRQPGSAFTVATPRHRRGATTTDRAAVAAGQRPHAASRPGCRSSVLGHPGGSFSAAD